MSIKLEFSGLNVVPLVSAMGGARLRNHLDVTGEESVEHYGQAAPEHDGSSVMSVVPGNMGNWHALSRTQLRHAHAVRRING